MKHFNRIPLSLLVVLFCLPTAAQKPSTKKPKLDLHGDPLPEGAIARLGTSRLRHRDWGRSLAFSPDGKTLVSGSSTFMKLWDTSTGKLKGEFPGAGGDIVFSKDGKQLLTFGKVRPLNSKRVIRLWDYKNKKILWEVDPEKSSPNMGPNVYNLAFHPDGKRIVVHTSNGSVFLLDRKTGAIGEFSSTEKSFYSYGARFALSANGRQAAIGGKGVVRLLRIPKAGQQFEKENKKDILKGLNGKVTALKYLSEEILIIAVHDKIMKRNDKGFFEQVKNDVLIEIWNVHTRKRVGRLFPSKDRDFVSSMAVSSDGKTLYVSHRKRIDTWDLEKKKRISDPPHWNRGMLSTGRLTLSKDEKLLASASASFVIHLWNLPERKSVLPENIGHHRIVKSIVWTPDGRYLVSGSHDGTVRFWEPTTGKEVKRFVYWNKGSQINDIAISRDGRTLVVVGTAFWKKPADLWGSVMIWDIESGKLIRDIRHARESEAVAISSDGKLVAFDSPNPFVRPRVNTVFVYQTATGKKLHQFDTEGKKTYGLGFSQDSSTLIVSSDQAGVFRWDLSTGEEMTRIVGLHYVPAAAFASKSEMVALYDRGPPIPAVKIHDLITGKERKFRMQFLPGQDYPTRFFYTSLSQYGGLVALKQGEFGTFGNGVNVIDTLTGQTILSTGPIDLITDVSLSPDGSKLATSFHNGIVIIWEVYLKSSRAKIEKGSSDLQKAALQKADLQKAWELLSASYMPKVWEAIDRMSGQPHKTVKLLSHKLYPKKEEMPRDVKKLITSLESGSFQDRRRAFSKLKSYGSIIFGELQQAVKITKSSEAKNRCRQLIEAAQIQNLRAVQILEMIGDNNSQELLQRIAKGNIQEKMTEEAERVLANMKLRR